MPEIHGGDIYSDNIIHDFSVSLNPVKYDDAEFMAAIGEGVKNRIYYPDILQRDVREKIAEFEGVNAGNIIAGNGASELIMAVAATVRPKCALLIKPCFSGYEHALKAVNDCNVKTVNLSEENGFEVTDDLCGYIDDDTGLLYLQDPWNPTGRNMDEDVLFAVLDRAKNCGCTVMLDNSFYLLSEKYIAGLTGFQCENSAPAGRTAANSKKTRTAELISMFPDLYIINSFTKSFACPGIRMGYAVTSQENIEKIRRCLPEWNVSSVATAVMKKCADTAADGSFFERSVRFIRDERKFVTSALKDMGFKVYKSDTVSVLFCENKKKDTNLFEKLKRHRILIRKFDEQAPGKGFFRIGIKTHEENVMLMKEIEGALRED